MSGVVNLNLRSLICNKTKHIIIFSIVTYQKTYIFKRLDFIKINEIYFK